MLWEYGAEEEKKGGTEDFLVQVTQDKSLMMSQQWKEGKGNFQGLGTCAEAQYSQEMKMVLQGQVKASYIGKSETMKWENKELYCAILNNWASSKEQGD